MKILGILILLLSMAGAELLVNVESFGKELGGWNAKGGKAADYSMSDEDYRTFRPVITETPKGGLFISVRIDYRRGLLSSDDHALLQVTLDETGKLLALESSIHAQGKSIKSDVVLTTGKDAVAVLGADPVVNAGLKLAKDLSAKLSGQKKVEAGRVVFPAVIVHNYNKLMKCVRFVAPPKAVVVEDQSEDKVDEIVEKKKAVSPAGE